MTQRNKKFVSKGKNLFITGMGGTTGRVLAKLSLSENYSVGGTIHQSFPAELKAFTDRDLLKYYQLDLTDLNEVKRAIGDFQPDVVLHLAGKVAGRMDKQYSNPTIYTENMTIFQNILVGLRHLANNPRLILSSGCIVYDKLTSPDFIAEVPVQNLAEVDPDKEPYRASKLDQEKLLVESKLDYIIARPTQYTGPGKTPTAVEYYVAREISGIMSGEKKKFGVRNKQSLMLRNKLGEVDILDVRDVARAYLTLIRKGVKGEIYHISSGSPTTVEQMAKLFLEVAGLNPTQFRVESTDREQTVYSRFSPAKLKGLGWNPKFSLKDALVSYWEYFKMN